MLDIESQGGGGQYIPEEYFTDRFTSGTFDTDQVIFNLTAPVNKRVRLEYLMSDSADDIFWLVVDGNVIITGALASYTSPYSLGRFFVSQSGGESTLQAQGLDIERVLIQDIIGENIQLIYKGSTTSLGIRYKFSYGRI